MGLTKPDDATSCSVPGCRRWSRRWPGEFICGEHWRQLSKRERRTWHRVQRTVRLIGDQWWQNRQLRYRYNRLWRALVRRAGLP